MAIFQLILDSVYMSGINSKYGATYMFFQIAFVRSSGGFWEAGLGLEVLPKTLAFTPLNLGPICLT